MFRINLKNGIDKSLDNNDHLYKLKEVLSDQSHIRSSCNNSSFSKIAYDQI